MYTDECPSTAELVRVYLAGEGDPGAGAIESHLSVCPDCSDEWRRVGKLAAEDAPNRASVPGYMPGSLRMTGRRIATTPGSTRSSRTWKAVPPARRRCGSP